jgi:hypothetical protein
LQTLQPAGGFRSAEENGASAFAHRVGIVALSKEAAGAKLADTTADGRGYDDTLADAYVADFAADAFDDADPLMAKDLALLHAGEGAADEMELRAANRAGSEAHDRILRVLDRGFGNILDADVADGVENDGFHNELPLPRSLLSRRRR